MKARWQKHIISLSGSLFKSLQPNPRLPVKRFISGASGGFSKRSSQKQWAPHAAAFTITAFAATALIYRAPTAYAEAPSLNRTIRLSEVRSHGADAERRWIVKGTSVYDITEWIPNHPGGDVILRAVGGVIDSYWDIFSIHKRQDVYDILEQYRIGDLDPRDLVDGRVPEDSVEDPFKRDPKRDERLIVHTQKPCNAETPTDALSDFLTDNSVFYVRNHLWVPQLDERDYTLNIELYDGEEKSYSLSDLKSKFPQVTVSATLQCSGNRRRHMTEEARYASGLQWDVGALSNATWTGVRLRDVLADTGFNVDEDDEDVKHVQFQGAEAYGASIPIEKATSRHGDVLLVHTMNGVALPRDHGYPLRVLVPGHVAARSVKWLRRITLADEESSSQWQQRDYKCFGPNQSGNDVDWSTAPAIQEVPVQSAITSLKDMPAAQNAKQLQVYGLEEDAIEVTGYALSGGGRRIIRVDVSADDGRSWNQAELLPNEAMGAKMWSWTRWRFVIPRRLAGRQFVVKAVDEGYNVQPDSYEPHYNFRGNLTSGWHRVAYARKR